MEASNVKAMLEAFVCANVTLCKALREARAAVAQTPKNCDVWTEHGQYHRFCDFCANHKCDIPCLTYRGGTFHQTECVMRWAQLPYESEVVK